MHGSLQKASVYGITVYVFFTVVRVCVCACVCVCVCVCARVCVEGEGPSLLQLIRHAYALFEEGGKSKEQLKVVY